MPSTPIRISLLRFATHDFGRALRIWRQNSEALDILERLASEQAKSLNSSKKQLAISVVLAFWLNASRNTLDIKLYLIDISIPSVYVNFALSLSIFGFMIASLNYYIIGEFVRVALNRMLKFDSPWAFNTLIEGSNAWNSTLISQFRFFKSRSTHRIALITILLVIFIPILLIVSFLFYVYIKNIALIYSSSSATSLEFLICISGLLLAASPVFVSIIILIPLKFDKNSRFIRWNFLFPLHKRAGAYPQRASEWRDL